MTTIIINKKTTPLFLAIAKQGLHSFLMLGTYDHNNNVTHLLCRVGKGLPQENEAKKSKTDQCVGFFKDISNGLFSHVESVLEDEKTTRKNPGNTPISYQAYDITYNQYIHFLQILESEQTPTNKLRCFKPYIEDERSAGLKLTSKPFCTPQKYDGLKIKELNIHNSCRHTAINIAKEIQVQPSSWVSSYFFVDLPYKTELEYGKPCPYIPFYVLPFPPTAYPQLSAAQRKVLETLYKRMERMLILEPDSPLTENKFLKLKELYNDILGAQHELGADQLQQSIQQWKLTNQTTLNVMRKTYVWDRFFTRKSATEQMFNSIEQDLQQTVLK